MRYLLSVLLIFNSLQASASQAKPVYVTVHPTQSSVVATGDYEDIRIDSNGDQAIDLWVVKKGPLRIATSFKNGKVVGLRITKSIQGKIADAQYVARNGSLKLAQSEFRNPQVMNGKGQKELCEEETEKVKSDIKNIKDALDAKNALIAAEEAVSCNNNEGDVYETLKQGTAKVIGDNQISKCLSGEKGASLGEENQPFVKYLAAKMELDLKRMVALETPKMITCEEAPAGGEITAKYTEGGKVVFKIPKGKTRSEISMVAHNLLNHELLHRAGVEDEKTTEAIMSLCRSDDKIKVQNATEKFRIFLRFKDDVGRSANNLADQPADTKDIAKAAQKVTSRSAATTSAEKGGGSENIEMKREIAAAEVVKAIPSSEKLAVNSTKATEDGQKQAVKESQRQTAPVLAMANNAMGAMSSPALAKNDSSSSDSSASYDNDSSSSSSVSTYSPSSGSSYTPSSSSSSSSNRATSGDRYQSRYNGYERKTRTTASSDHDFNKGVYTAGTVPANLPSSNSGSAMPIIVPPRPDNAGTGTNSRSVASSERSGSVAGSPVEVSGGANGGGGGSTIGGSSGGSGTYFSDESPSRKTNAPTRSGTSVSNGSSRDIVISDFSGTSYSEMKIKLRDREYQNTLSSYQITVVDRNGSMIGASRGTTVFLDDGSRFVIQRRK